ncbi:hypothetical protein ACO2Q3_22585 [Caulobacter sp. KR2-114]|uniref:hypothetical protein n=1 Tax=Caulobacter sp. KR2-114 TaxID=3400912 RepID=UPI003C0D3A98
MAANGDLAPITKLPTAEQRAELCRALVTSRMPPTPRELRELDATLTVNCPACTALKQPHGLIELLIARGKADVTIDQIVFRCEDHGQRGEPIAGVSIDGMGRQRLWPPGDIKARLSAGPIPRRASLRTAERHG